MATKLEKVTELLDRLSTVKSYTLNDFARDVELMGLKYSLGGIRVNHTAHILAQVLADPTILDEAPEPLTEDEVVRVLLHYAFAEDDFDFNALNRWAKRRGHPLPEVTYAPLGRWDLDIVRRWLRHNGFEYLLVRPQ